MSHCTYYTTVMVDDVPQLNTIRQTKNNRYGNRTTMTIEPECSNRVCGAKTTNDVCRRYCTLYFRALTVCLNDRRNVCLSACLAVYLSACCYDALGRYCVFTEHSRSSSISCVNATKCGNEIQQKTKLMNVQRRSKNNNNKKTDFCCIKAMGRYAAAVALMSVLLVLLLFVGLGFYTKSVGVYERI